MPDYLYGRRAVLEALRARQPIEQIVIAQGVHTRGALNELIALAHAAGVRVRQVPRAELDRITAHHQGILAEIEEFQYAELEDLLAVGRTRKEATFLLMLDSVQDPQNLGTLLRTAEAVGVHGVILAEHRAAGITPAVVKSSAGAVAHLKIARITNLSRTIGELKRSNIWVIGVENDLKAQPYTAADFTIPLTLVLGSEGSGLGRLVAEKCDFLLRLPMWGKIESLNVAVAGSIVLYAARMQRLTADAFPQSAETKPQRKKIS